MRILAIATAAMALATSASAAEPAALARWVQYAAEGGVEARVAVAGDMACPEIRIDGTAAAMRERSAPGPEFPLRVCSASLPANAQRASVLDRPLPMPVAAPDRILVLGDTGCRLKGKTIQACNDPEAWPFAALAERAAALHPDLVIDVGDYHYRESPCPAGNSACAGPSGYGWAVWSADFFVPAEPLLAAAPWVIVRGNHEDCSRAWNGFFRLLGAYPWDGAQPCAVNEPPYLVALGRLDLIVFDNASADDAPVDSDQFPTYRTDFDRAAGLGRGPAWLLMHKPMRGVVASAAGETVGGNATLAALNPSLPASVELLLAGHIHAFEAINYAAGSPPQFVVGNGGDWLDTHVPPDLAGLEVGGLKIRDGLSLKGFGFLLMSRDAAGWRADAYDARGILTRHCTFAHREIACERG